MATSRLATKTKSGTSLIVLPLLAALITTCAALPVADPWQEPCGSGGTAATPDVTMLELLGNLSDKAQDLGIPAGTMKDILTTGDNPRVPSAVVSQLELWGTTVTNFPHDFHRNPQHNLTVVLVTDYVVLSKAYIFLQQSAINTVSCDQWPDGTASLLSATRSVQHRLRLALCSVHTALDVLHTPMPADLIPSADVVLAASVPNVKELELCQDQRRSAVDYLLARDTVRLSQELHAQYVILHERLLASS